MKILVVEGSPRKNGNSSTLALAIAEAAARRGHEIASWRLYDSNFRGCLACGACDEPLDTHCAMRDEFTARAPEIVAADLIVFATPVYFGQVSGPMKLFIDRWCAFFDREFRVRHVSGKRYMVVTASNAPADKFASVADYFRTWFTDFFKMTHVGQIVAGDLGPADAARSRPELLELAARLGESI